MTDSTPKPLKLRSAAWFDNPANIDMTALYLERYLNFGISLEELRSGRPIIGIAQTGSDLSPCNRHHLVLAERVREGIRTSPTGDRRCCAKPSNRPRAPRSDRRVLPRCLTSAAGLDSRARPLRRWPTGWSASIFRRR